MNDKPQDPPPPQDAPPPPPSSEPPPASDAPPGAIPTEIPSTPDERSMAMLAHLLGIVTGFIGPVIVWAIKKDQSAFVDFHGKQALNFQFTILIASVVSSILMFCYVGCILLPAVAIINIVFPILAGMAANQGQLYRYPVAIPFFKT